MSYEIGCDYVKLTSGWRDIGEPVLLPPERLIEAARQSCLYYGLEVQDQNANGRNVVAENGETLHRQKVYAFADVDDVTEATQALINHIWQRHGSGRVWFTGRMVSCLGAGIEGVETRVMERGHGSRRVVIASYYFHQPIRDEPRPPAPVDEVGLQKMKYQTVAADENAVNGFTVTAAADVPPGRVVMLSGGTATVLTNVDFRLQGQPAGTELHGQELRWGSAPMSYEPLEFSLASLKAPEVGTYREPHPLSVTAMAEHAHAYKQWLIETDHKRDSAEFMREYLGRWAPTCEDDALSKNEAELRFNRRASMRVQIPIDPLEVEYDGVRLHTLMRHDKAQREEMGSPIACEVFRLTRTQREAVSAHWSAQLRAEIQASAAATQATENRSTLDADPEDYPW